MTTKDYLHELINRLPENSTDAAGHFLEYLADTDDPVLRALWEAPIDDEPLSDEDRASLAAGWEDIKAGRIVTLEEVERELGDNR